MSEPDSQPVCALCRKPVDAEDAFCHGCRSSVCDECDDETPWGPHELYDHVAFDGLDGEDAS